MGVVVEGLESFREIIYLFFFLAIECGLRSKRSGQGKVSRPKRRTE